MHYETNLRFVLIFMLTHRVSLFEILISLPLVGETPITRMLVINRYSCPNGTNGAGYLHDAVTNNYIGHTIHNRVSICHGIRDVNSTLDPLQSVYVSMLKGVSDRLYGLFRYVVISLVQHRDLIVNTFVINYPDMRYSIAG